jgi:hypothetical protein
VFAAIRQNLPLMVQKQFGLARDYGPKFAQQDITQSKEFAPQYAGLGLDLSKQFAPQYQGLNLEQMQRNIAGQPLLSSLNQQAQQGLDQKGQLTPQEAYLETQGSLAPFAGRNNVFNQAEATAFLNRDALVRQRQQQAQQFGAQVQGLDTQQLAGLGGVVQPPNFAAYGAPGSSFGPMGAGIGATSGTVGQIAPIASEIFGSNQSAAANQAIGGANKSGGMLGAGIGAVGSIAAAAL